jgi:hypothetical protein
MNTRESDETRQISIDRHVNGNEQWPTYRRLLEDCIDEDDPIGTISRLAATWSAHFEEFPITHPSSDGDHSMVMYDPFKTFELLDNGDLPLQGFAEDPFSANDLVIAQALSTIFILTSQICPGFDIWNAVAGNIKTHCINVPYMKSIYVNSISNARNWQYLPKTISIPWFLEQLELTESEEDGE